MWLIICMFKNTTREKLHSAIGVFNAMLLTEQLRHPFLRSPSHPPTRSLTPAVHRNATSICHNLVHFSGKITFLSRALSFCVQSCIVEYAALLNLDTNHSPARSLQCKRCTLGSLASNILTYSHSLTDMAHHTPPTTTKPALFAIA